MDKQLLDELVEARDQKRPVALLTELSSGRQALLWPADPRSAPTFSAEVHDAAALAVRRDRCVTLESGGERVFVQAFNPRLRMVVVGAVHIAQVLAPMASMLDYEVTVVDPRASFASPERFPEVNVVTEWPDDALTALEPDARTAIVTLTHDPKLDDPALEIALGTEAFYVGSLGSQRTHAARLARLRTSGFCEAALARIHAPIGLAIRAQSPAEIATAILAEVTSVLRDPDA